MVIKVITPHEVLFEGEGQALTAPSPVGELGILPGHLPIFIQLDDDIITVKLAEEDYLYIAVNGGILENINDEIHILTPFAIADQDMDNLHQRLNQEAENAQLKFKRSKKDRLAHQRAKIQLQQAINQLNGPHKK